MIQAFVRRIAEAEVQVEVIKFALELWLVPNGDGSLPAGLKVVIENTDEKRPLNGFGILLLGETSHPANTSSTLLNPQDYSVYGTTKESRLSATTNVLAVYDGIPNVKVAIDATIATNVYQISSDVLLTELDVVLRTPLLPGERIASRLAFNLMTLYDQSPLSRHITFRLFHPAEPGQPREHFDRLAVPLREIPSRLVFDPNEATGGFGGGFDIALYVPSEYRQDVLSPPASNVSINRSVDPQGNPNKIPLTKYTWRARQILVAANLDKRLRFGDSIIIDATFTSLEQSALRIRDLVERADQKSKWATIIAILSIILGVISIVLAIIGIILAIMPFLMHQVVR